MTKLILGYAAFATVAASAATTHFDSAGIEFFEKKVRPVLAEHCYECHSHQAKKLKANLYLDSRAGLLEGGETGVAIVLGEPDKSRLIEAVRYTNSDRQMPPKKKLPDAIIADLAAWIKMGAPWPQPERMTPPSDLANKETPADQRKRDHWAWQPIRAPRPPAVKDSTWLRNDLDAFILAKLEEKGLKPSPPADRRTLIRRAYFDLIGLPPSAEEVEGFVEDKSPDAFAKVVDRLLASPNYGERFGRHWLDVARYGEDQAHSFQPRLYPQGFRYRDWLVHAFNDDLAYDRFVREQIAADLLDAPDRTDRLAALGFFATGPVYYGDKKMFDQLDDRIDTLTRGFLGLTVACARCHDHKYDPVTQKDYYALAGVFASTEYAEVPTVPPAVVEAYERAQAAIQSKTKEIDQLIDDAGASLTKGLPAEISRYMVAAWKLVQQRRTDPQKTVEVIAKQEGLHSFILDRWVKYLATTTPENPRQYLARWRQVLEQQDAKADLSSQQAALEDARKAAEGFQKFVLATVKLRDTVEEQYAAAQANAADKDKPARLALDKTQTTLLEEILGKEGLLTVSKNQAEKILGPESKTKLAGLRNDLDKLKKTAPPKYPFVHALKEGSKPADVPVLLRGNSETPGDPAPRRFLTILGGEQAPAFHNGSGRLELASAIADSRNPLTARVMVNRIWQHHFGRGIVRTPSNFGVLGEPPTHPELLDFLADQFMRQGWSLKSLHRSMLLSAAYQMSSRFDARNNELDPENKFLWRMNRQRLEVEAWRDAMLAVSGSLDQKMGGPSIDLASAANCRRTFYTTVSRHDLNSLLRLFDFPDPNVTSDTRTVTTVPLQQLFVLNSEFMVRQAKALAGQLTATPQETDAQRIHRAFGQVYGRPPSDRELQLGLRFVSQATPMNTASAGIQQASFQSGARSALSKWEQYAQVLLSSNEFMYVD